MKNWQKKQLTRANCIKKKEKKANAQKPPDIARKSAWCVPALDGSCLCILQEQEEGANLTQEVMGREGSVSGVGGGAYKLVRSKSLNFFPIKASALSTCCWVPKKQTKQQKQSIQKGHGWPKIVAFIETHVPSIWQIWNSCV